MLKATVYSDDPVSVARRWVDAAPGETIEEEE